MSSLCVCAGWWGPLKRERGGELGEEGKGKLERGRLIEDYSAEESAFPRAEAWWWWRWTITILPIC